MLSGSGLCDGLITRPEESYRLWCVFVCNLGTSRMRRLKLVERILHLLSAISLQAWTGPWGSRRLRHSEFLDNRHMKVVKLSVLRTDRFYLPADISSSHFWGWVDLGGIVRPAGKNNPIGNRTRDSPACSPLPQPTVPPRTPIVPSYPCTISKMNPEQIRIQNCTHLLYSRACYMSYPF
jgi:hypothetical protein